MLSLSDTTLLEKQPPAEKMGIQKKRKRVRRRVKATQKAIEYRPEVAGGPKVLNAGPPGARPIPYPNA
jgi:hypothetical protein